MIARIQSLASAMRRAGVRVTTSEIATAAAAANAVGLIERQTLKSAMRAAMCHSTSEVSVFDTLFDVYFAINRAPELSQPSDPPTDAEMFEQLVDALDANEINSAAAALLARFSSQAQGGLLLYRAMGFVDPPRMVARLASRMDEDLPEAVAKAKARQQIALLRFRLEELVRAQLAQELGPDELAARINRVPMTQKDFATITADEAAAMRRAVAELSRRVASKLAKLRRPGHHGRLDVRATMRRSLSYGGSPAEPRFRRRSPSRPELVLLCDVSGSVAAFTRFTLLFIASLQSYLPRVRSFLFVDTTDEVTPLLKSSDLSTSIPKALQFAQTVSQDGHTDYGNAFRVFRRRYLEAITDTSHIVILGDARNNNRNPQSDELKAIAARCKKVWWLNCEPERYWDTGDSVMAAYKPHCDVVVECRNLTQLARFVERLSVRH